MLDARIAFRLPIVITGTILATGRRTAACWFCAARIKDDWDRFYDLLAAVGPNATSWMLPLVTLPLRRFDPGPDRYRTLMIDDSPTERGGRHVEAVNIDHNQMPGPGDGD
jgi:hypothetical protein